MENRQHALPFSRPIVCTKESLDSLERMIRRTEALPPVSLAALPADQTVLVVVDMVNGFAKEGPLSSPRVRALIPGIAELQTQCAALGIPVVAFADAHTPKAAEFSAYPPHCVAGTAESRVVDELQAAGPYRLIEKNSTNGYLEPAFQAYLAQNPHRSTFIVVGDCTDICVEQFATTLKADRNRQDRPCRVIVPVNAVDTYDLPYAIAEPAGAQFHDGDLMHLVALHSLQGNGIEVVSAVK